MGQLEQGLADLGFEERSADELRRSGKNYRSAVPLLLSALKHERDYKKKEQIVRALSVPWARPAAIAPLIDEYETVSADDPARAGLLRWAIGNALEVIWDDDYFHDLVTLARDRRFGRSREMLVLGLGKSKRKDEAAEVLLSLVGDSDVDGHAVAALAKLGLPSTRAALEEAASHQKPWVRKAAQRGLSKLQIQADTAD